MKTLNNPNKTLENKIRKSGEWVLLDKDPDHLHYMVAKHPKTELCISLCWGRIRLFSQVCKGGEIPHCKVCESFLDLRREVVNRKKQKVFVIQRRAHKIHNPKP